ncbi:hypothetical protein [Sulfitobacter sp. AS59]|uniref:hypothetical protein n=1 Tax=Sulfitobacter sp. AS59 TaxID=3135784 RepID=UPI00316C0F05
MNGVVSLNGSVGAVPLLRLGEKLMDIILHVGAHRTATTSFQRYLRDNSDAIAASKTGIWGPLRTRKGLFSGIFPGPKMQGRSPERVKGRVALQLARARENGVARLLVSEENMIGSSRHCVRTGVLFPAAGDRMARYCAAFDGNITRIILNIRSPETWWSSAAAYAISRGHGVPSPSKLDKIAASQRSWRDVITDLACAVPNAEIKVATFEEYAGRPDALLAEATGVAAPVDRDHHWLNRAPDLPALRAMLAERGQDPDLLPDETGRWNPFNDAQAAALRETYSDDLFWLTAGADGLAQLTENSVRERAGTSQPSGNPKKGHPHDSRQRYLAQSG